MQVHTCTSVFVSPYGPCLADSVSHVLLVSPPSELQGEESNRILQFRFSLHIMSGCASLHLFPPAARGSLSNDNWTRHQPRNIAEYHEESLHFVDFFSIPVWFYPRSLSIHFLVTGHPNSVGHGLVLVVLASRYNRHWLPAPTSPALPWPQQILQAGQVVG